MIGNALLVYSVILGSNKGEEGEMLYFCVVYLHFNDTLLHTGLPWMVFQDEILYDSGASVASGLVCRSHDGATPSWYHPYNLVVQNVNIQRAHTKFAHTVKKRVLPQHLLGCSYACLNTTPLGCYIGCCECTHRVL